ncbi:MAG: Asp23/Gls24 family envelope stress response protein [Oscillospiraceae bacterium]|nr:Asp23/Gls24 family envelope stress response protein [Oscillospiraceae bacterium]
MPERKEYITHVEEGGTININEEVVAVIAAATVLEVNGAVIPGACKDGQGCKSIDKKRLFKSVNMCFDETKEDTVSSIECSIYVRFGHNIVEVASAVQTAVKETVEAVTGLTVEKVNVNVCGVAFAQKQ